jgi:hypothetical protein
MGNGETNRVGSGTDEGRYVNHFEITHNAFEFFLHFGQRAGQDQEARMHTKIVISPFYAKRLMRVLSRAIRRYEQRFGRVPEAANEAVASE